VGSGDRLQQGCNLPQLGLHSGCRHQQHPSPLEHLRPLKTKGRAIAQGRIHIDDDAQGGTPWSFDEFVGTVLLQSDLALLIQ
jgi:hypothetical protein